MKDGRRWVFRVASRPGAGGGHVARCITLAREVARLGDRVVFVLDDDGLNWASEITREGHDCVGASSWSGSASGVLLDGYDFDEDTAKRLDAGANVTAVIVDEPPVPTWADIAIAPGLDADSTAAMHGVVLTDLDHALVDPRFRGVPCREAVNGAARVLVSFGLRDSHNATGLVLDALEMTEEMRAGVLSVTVTLGNRAPHRDAVRARVRHLSGVVVLLNADMAHCYAQADLAIGGGGVGLLERMAVGVPSITIGLASNQRAQISLCAARGGTSDAGCLEDVTAEGLARAISMLLRSPERRNIMSRGARAAVDGRGAERCAQVLWKSVRAH